MRLGVGFEVRPTTENSKKRLMGRAQRTVWRQFGSLAVWQFGLAVWQFGSLAGSLGGEWCVSGKLIPPTRLIPFLWKPVRIDEADLGKSDTKYPYGDSDSEVKIFVRRLRLASSAPRRPTCHNAFFRRSPQPADAHNDEPPSRAWAVPVEENTVRDSEELRLKTIRTSAR